MGIYIFPIFLFGCAITGIVFLGVQQAVDWAQDEAVRNRETGSGPENSTTHETPTDTKVRKN
jgi:hypothetical protein